MSSPLKRIAPDVTRYAGSASSVLASVDLPEPFGPISAWTSPSPTVERDAAEDLVAVDRDVQVVDLEERAAAGRP